MSGRSDAERDVIVVLVQERGFPANQSLPTSYSRSARKNLGAEPHAVRPRRQVGACPAITFANTVPRYLLPFGVLLPCLLSRRYITSHLRLLCRPCAYIPPPPTFAPRDLPAATPTPRPHTIHTGFRQTYTYNTAKMMKIWSMVRGCSACPLHSVGDFMGEAAC